jgi:hypothetical protein
LTGKAWYSRTALRVEFTIKIILGGVIMSRFLKFVIIVFVLCLVSPWAIDADASKSNENTDDAEVKTDTARIALVGADLTPEGEKIQKSIQAEFKKKHITTFSLQADQLSDPAILNTNNIDAIVWSGANTYPANSGDTILKYLEDGGDLVVLGAQPFSNPLWKVDNEWLSKDGIRSTPDHKEPALKMHENRDSFHYWKRMMRKGKEMDIRLG